VELFTSKVLELPAGRNAVSWQPACIREQLSQAFSSCGDSPEHVDYWNDMGWTGPVLLRRTTSASEKAYGQAGILFFLHAAGSPCTAGFFDVIGSEEAGIVGRQGGCARPSKGRPAGKHSAGGGPDIRQGLWGTSAHRCISPIVVDHLSDRQGFERGENGRPDAVALRGGSAPAPGRSVCRRRRRPVGAVEVDCFAGAYWKAAEPDFQTFVQAPPRKAGLASGRATRKKRDGAPDRGDPGPRRPAMRAHACEGRLMPGREQNAPPALVFLQFHAG